MQFAPATKKKSRLRLAILGPSGSGKTYSALAIGKHLAATLKSPLAVIDTERGSASKYAGDVADFSVLELTSFSPGNYIKAIRLAQANGFKVIIVDSLSHAWFGADGILDQKDKKGDTSFGAWRTLTPQHNDLVEAILAFDGHIICTMRSKMEYVQEKDAKGKTTVRKVGLAPVQREGMEYEFDVIGEMDVDNCMHVTKTRCSALADASIRKPGADVATILLDWLDQGVDEAPRPAAPTPEVVPQAPAPTMDMEPVYLLAEMVCDLEIIDDQMRAWFAGEVGKVTPDSKMGKAVAYALDSLFAQRCAQLADEDWVAEPAAQRSAAKLRTALVERSIAKKQTEQPLAAE